MIVAKAIVRAALDRAQALQALDIEEACAAVAQSLAIPVETVREVAYEVQEA